MSIAIRAATDADSPAFRRIVEAAWAAHVRQPYDFARWAPELQRPATALAALRGAAWAADAEGSVVGLATTWPSGDEWELGKLYVDPAHQGAGAGAALLGAAEAWARASGANEMRLWSDSRLGRAHAFYEKHSYVRGAVRADGGGGIDLSYAKPLRGTVVRVLDAAGAESARTRLVAILSACVANGASVSFLQPLDTDRARAFWQKTAREVATGAVRLLAAWHEGELVGTVTLRCDTPENQPHRGEIAKMLVHPDARRRGVARALMVAADETARAAGRWLLTLDTASDAAEALYRDLDWVCAGRIPDYALLPDGAPCDTLLFWKRLDQGER